MTAVKIHYGTYAYYDLLDAVKRAEAEQRDVSISIDANGRGEAMTAVKVGEDVWTAHRLVFPKGQGR